MTGAVLVVGAGPVGLTAALALTRQGIACRIVDRLPQRINQSRAAILQPRTLEVLERLDVVDRILDASVEVYGLHAVDEAGKTLLRATLDDLPTKYNFLTAIGQDETERLLAEALGESGVAVEREVELVGLAQSDDRVTATLVHADGREERYDTPYLIGCDGARSTVRHQLGLRLEGETLDAYWVTADVRVEWERPSDEIFVIAATAGFGFASTLPDGRWRVILDMGERPETLPDRVPLEAVQEACDRLGMNARLHDPIWISPFGVNTRMVPTMRAGRVFLAGDASHIHSPIGGQGMNTGMQDVLNLAWKLALTVDGRARPALLDSYDTERHANVKRLLRLLGPVTKMVSRRSSVAGHLRKLAMHTAGHLGVATSIFRWVSELDVHYRHSPVVGEHHHPHDVEWLRGHVDDEPSPSLLDCFSFGKGPHPGERADDAEGVADGAASPGRLYDQWIGDPAPPAARVHRAPADAGPRRAAGRDRRGRRGGGRRDDPRAARATRGRRGPG